MWSIFSAIEQKRLLRASVMLVKPQYCVNLRYINFKKKLNFLPHFISTKCVVLAPTVLNALLCLVKFEWDSWALRNAILSASFHSLQENALKSYWIFLLDQERKWNNSMCLLKEINLKLMHLTENEQNNSISCPYPEWRPCNIFLASLIKQN